MDDPIQQAQADKRSFEVAGETKMVTDGSSNAYEIVADDYTSQHGGSGNGYISIEQSDKNNKTGAHEVGHSIGIDHSDGLMHKGINGSPFPTVTNWDVKDVFVNPAAAKARQSLYGNVPNEHKKGTVKTALEY